MITQFFARNWVTRPWTDLTTRRCSLAGYPRLSSCREPAADTATSAWLVCALLEKRSATIQRPMLGLDDTFFNIDTAARVLNLHGYAGHPLKRQVLWEFQGRIPISSNLCNEKPVIAFLYTILSTEIRQAVRWGDDYMDTISFLY